MKVSELDRRIWSASAAFQKGIYHLFWLRRGRMCDQFDRILRSYQCMFDLCRTQLLLDSSFKLDPSKDHRWSAHDPSSIDLSVLVTHAHFDGKKRKWGGFGKHHPLAHACKHSLALVDRLVEARHSLIYRPQLKAGINGPFWEDCDLLTELRHAPAVDEIEDAYRQSVNGMVGWDSEERGSGMRTAASFLQCLFCPYKDVNATRPTETVFLSYARALGDDEGQLKDAIAYRNSIADPDMVRSLGINLLPNWRSGDV